MYWTDSPQAVFEYNQLIFFTHNWHEIGKYEHCDPSQEAVLSLI